MKLRYQDFMQRADLQAKDDLKKGSDRNCLEHLGKHTKNEEERGKEGKRGPRSQICVSWECGEDEYNSVDVFLEEMQ